MRVSMFERQDWRMFSRSVLLHPLTVWLSGCCARVDLACVGGSVKACRKIPNPRENGEQVYQTRFVILLS